MCKNTAEFRINILNLAVFFAPILVRWCRYNNIDKSTILQLD